MPPVAMPSVPMPPVPVPPLTVAPAAVQHSGQATAPSPEPLRREPGVMAECERLAASLQQIRTTRRLRNVMVTSAAEREPAAAASVQLALTLSASSMRVLLIDANLAEPTLHTRFGAGAARGLSDWLVGAIATVPHTAITSHLSLLCAGQSQLGDTRDVASGRLALLLEQCAGPFDWVLLNAPPIAGAADARLLVERVDGVIVVIGARTSFAAAERAIASIGRASIVGTLLEGVPGLVPPIERR